MRMTRAALLLMLAACPAMAAAQAQAPTCVPQPQAAALVTFALPTLVTQVAKRCGEELPPNTYLVGNASALAERYRPAADAAWPEARRAIAGLFTRFLGQPMPDEVDGEMLRLLVEPTLGKLLAKQVNPADCVTIDAAVAAVAPLSGQALGRLAALLAAVADRKGTGIAGVLRVCKPEEHR
jgi:hypothetical protein